MVNDPVANLVDSSGVLAPSDTPLLPHFSHRSFRAIVVLSPQFITGQYLVMIS